MLTSCFIGNCRGQASPIQLLTAVRWLVRRLVPFAKFLQTTHHNATLRLHFHSPAIIVYTTLQVSTTRKSSSLYPAELISHLLAISQDIPQNNFRYRSPYVDTPWWRPTFCRFRTFLFLKDVERKAAAAYRLILFQRFFCRGLQCSPDNRLYLIASQLLQAHIHKHPIFRASFSSLLPF